MPMNTLPFAFPLEANEIRKRRAEILALLFSNDPAFCQIPVGRLSAHTLQKMLYSYDNTFLSGYLQKAYGTLSVTLSSRLTSSAGKFIYFRHELRRLESAEIRMSSDFLYRLTDGPFSLNGLTVATPQEAFLIVFEHELCHALETALFGKTGHSKRFLSLANGLFGHTQTHHNLPTRKHEAAQSGLSVGMKVTFPYEDKQLTGLVTYIGKTATVMVPALRGPYRDKLGRRYRKYRVPLELLKSP